MRFLEFEDMLSDFPTYGKGGGEMTGWLYGLQALGLHACQQHVGRGRGKIKGPFP